MPQAELLQIFNPNRLPTIKLQYDFLLFNRFSSAATFQCVVGMVSEIKAITANLSILCTCQYHLQNFSFLAVCTLSRADNLLTTAPQKLLYLVSYPVSYASYLRATNQYKIGSQPRLHDRKNTGLCVSSHLISSHKTNCQIYPTRSLRYDIPEHHLVMQETQLETIVHPIQKIYRISSAAKSE